MASTISPQFNFNETYHVGNKLGTGNYSIVCEVKSIQTGEVHAAKIIEKASLSVEDAKELRNEITILATLDHPNIVKFISFFEDQQRYYIVTELLQGGELFDKIVEKEFYSERDAQTALQTIGSALKYCHDRGIVHRDLKPENILLSTPGDDAELKLADFGFAKSIDDGALKTSLGTPGYVAPEILRGQGYKMSVDMWALGVIMYILLSGYPPFYSEENNQPELFRKIKNAEFEFDEPYWTNVSDAAKDLIMHLLCLDVSKRYTIDQFLGHEWMTKDLSGKDITPAIGELKAFLNRRRLRVGIRAAMAVQRFSRATGGGATEGGATESQ